MTIREYAEAHQIRVVGKLRRYPARDESRDPDGTRFQLFIDEAGTEYTINRNGTCIVTPDGNVT